jgi:hypothetical protein
MVLLSNKKFQTRLCWSWSPWGSCYLIEYGHALVFVGHSTSHGLVVVVENGLAFIMGSFTSCTDSANHRKGHQVHDPNVKSSDNVVDISDSQSNGFPFVPPCKKQKNEGENKK